MLDASGYVPTAASAPVSAVVFLSRGSHDIAHIEEDEVLARLGAPVSVLSGCAEATRGYGEAFARLARGARGIRFAVDHRLGLRHAADAVAEAVSR